MNDTISRDEDGTPDMGQARAWSRVARPGQYLATYSEYSGDDHGSRCGYADDQLDELGRILRKRGLRIDTDDVGLRVCLAPDDA